jgi:hypothetical protein
VNPYYQDDAVTIYHGDSRDVLPSISGDVVITDPPYANGTEYDGSFDDDSEYLTSVVVGGVIPLARASAPLTMVTPGVRSMFAYPEPTWTLAWVNAASSGRGPWGFSTWQPVLAYGPDPYLAGGRGCRPDSLVVTTGGGSLVQQLAAVDHPCPKPERFIKWLLERSTVSTSVVIDPFMGSGTTLRAAKDHGHKAIGIELSERYCEIAAKRMAQGVLDLTGVS